MKKERFFKCKNLFLLKGVVMKRLIIINYENQYLDNTFGDDNTFIADRLQK